jgi:hypothetical protein
VLRASDGTVLESGGPSFTPGHLPTVVEGALVTHQKVGPNTDVDIYDRHHVKNPLHLTLRSTNVVQIALSRDHQRLATTDGSAVRIWSLEELSRDYSKASLAELRNIACTQLMRFQPHDRDAMAACRH